MHLPLFRRGGNAPCVQLLMASILLFTLGAVPSAARAATDWSPLFPRLVEAGLDEDWVKKVFSSNQLVYDRDPMRDKLHVLHRILRGGTYVEKIQEGLNKLGCGVEKVDGKYGPATKAAIEAFQLSRGLVVNGLPNQEVIDAIEKELIETGKQKPPQACWTHTRKHEGVMKPFRLAEAREFNVAHHGTLQAMEKTFNVPGEMVTAIITVETRHGRIVGRDKSINILASMALDGDSERAKRFFTESQLNPSVTHWLKETAKKRGDWAFEELAALLRWCRVTGTDPFTVPSSPYGAVGWPQFMPSNIEKFGVDGNEDGIIDLFDPRDAIHSVGKYFKGWGWTGEDMNLAEKQKVVWHYNRSERYVNTILAVHDHVAAHLEPEPVPEPKGGVQALQVASMQELLAAIGPNRHITLAPGNYAGGWALKIDGVQNLTFVGKGEVVLPAVAIAGSSSIFLENLAISPSNEDEVGVAIADSKDITIQHVRILGAGDVVTRGKEASRAIAGGVAIANSQGVRVLQTLIEHVKGPALTASASENVSVHNSVVRNIEAPAIFVGKSTPKVSITRGVLRDNVGQGLVAVDAASPGWSVTNSYFDDNEFPVLASKEGSAVTSKGNIVSGGKVAGLR